MHFKQNRYLIFYITVFCLFLFISCKQKVGVFERNTTIPSYSWHKNFTPAGTFTINDTVGSYNIYLVLRHTDAYQYNNIWLNVGLKSPGDSMYFQKVNLSLGSDATGWEGTGMNDIWEVRKLLNGRPQRFIKPGEYHYEIRHIMREVPLDGIMSAGFRVEKSASLVNKN
jgi:gliding motility-associated lipoprotein GldH